MCWVKVCQRRVSESDLERPSKTSTRSTPQLTPKPFVSQRPRHHFNDYWTPSQSANSETIRQPTPRTSLQRLLNFQPISKLGNHSSANAQDVTSTSTELPANQQTRKPFVSQRPRHHFNVYWTPSQSANSETIRQPTPKTSLQRLLNFQPISKLGNRSSANAQDVTSRSTELPANQQTRKPFVSQRPRRHFNVYWTSSQSANSETIRQPTPKTSLQRLLNFQPISKLGNHSSANAQDVTSTSTELPANQQTRKPFVSQRPRRHFNVYWTSSLSANSETIRQPTPKTSLQRLLNSQPISKLGNHSSANAQDVTSTSTELPANQQPAKRTTKENPLTQRQRKYELQICAELAHLIYILASLRKSVQGLNKWLMVFQVYATAHFCYKLGFHIFILLNS